MSLNLFFMEKDFFQHHIKQEFKDSILPEKKTYII